MNVGDLDLQVLDDLSDELLHKGVLLLQSRIICEDTDTVTGWLGPTGTQVGATWDPSGTQVGLKWDPSGTPV